MVSREGEFPIEITRVVDGDGFEARVLDGSGRTIEVRLYAIDAPEGAQKYGEEATNHLRKEVEGGRFWLEVNRTDPNGRTVAVVYKDIYDTVCTLNYLMIRAGWAYWYSNYDTKNSLGLREAEIAAYLDGNGVWQEPELELPEGTSSKECVKRLKKRCVEKLKKERGDWVSHPQKSGDWPKQKSYGNGIARQRMTEDRER